MAEYQIIKDALRTAGQFYIEILQKELIFQEHVASRKLINGFKTFVYERGGNLRMEVQNDTPYMWMVNEGNTSAPNVEFEDIKSWSKLKGLDFSSKKIWSITKALHSSYYTAGGLLVAPRRTDFIDEAFGLGDSLGISKMVEQDILKQIDAVIGGEGESKAIQLTIS